jgi:hypothetical protein
MDSEPMGPARPLRASPLAQRMLAACIPLGVSLGALACGRTDLEGQGIGGVAAGDQIGIDSGADATGPAPIGSFGDAAVIQAPIQWCDAGPPYPFVIPGITCGLFLAVPCGLPPDMVPEASGLLSPNACARLCPTDRPWDSCSVADLDGAVEPGVVVVCVHDCG